MSRAKQSSSKGAMTATRKRHSHSGGTPSVEDAGLTSKEKAYHKIRRSILQGECAPASALSEYRLAAQFRLSRTPVREALTRLEREGMVRTIPGRGAFVTELTPHDIMEIYQVREQLESYAARVAAEHMGVDDIRTLEHIIQQMHECAAAAYTNETFETDVSLHKTILSSTDNKRLITILATLDDQMHRIRSLWSRTPQWLDGTLAEHDRIVECIRNHDPDGADEAMRVHLHSACDRAIHFLMPMRR